MHFSPILYFLLFMLQGVIGSVYVTEKEQVIAHYIGGLVLVAGYIFVAVFVQITYKYFSRPIPFDPIILIVFIIVGTITRECDYTAYYYDVLKVFHRWDIQRLFTSVFLFRASLFLDLRVFMKHIKPILIISIPVAILNGFGSGTLIVYLLHKRFDLELTMLWGIVLTPIDPTKLVEYEHKSGSNTKYIRILLESETILSVDAMVICYSFYRTHSGKGYWFNDYAIFVELLSGYILGHIGCLVLRFFYNDRLMLTSFVLLYPMLVYSTVLILFDYGVTLLIIIGLMMSKERSASISSDIESYLQIAINILLYILIVPIYMMSALYFSIVSVPQVMASSNFAFVVASYLLSGVFRVVVFVCVSPIVRFFGDGLITIKHVAICAFANLKSPVFLSCYLGFILRQEYRPETRILYSHYLMIYLISYIVVPIVFPWIIQITGLRKISYWRQASMNNCINHLNETRHKTLTMLQYQKFLAAVDWELIRKHTEVLHPYRGKELEDTVENFEEYLQFKMKTNCPVCGKLLHFIPSKKDQNEMMKDALMRVLKAKKISFIRQFENGTLMKPSLFYLLQAVEHVRNTNRNLLDIEVLENLFNRRSYSLFCRNRLNEIYRSLMGDVKQPRRPYRQICHWIVQHPAFDPLMFVCTMLLLALICADYILRQWMMEFMYTYLAFLILFLVEFVMKILSYSFIYLWKDGVRSYYRNRWNLLDFTALTTMIICTILYCYRCITINCKLGVRYPVRTRDPIGIVLACLHPLQCIRLLRVTKLLKPLFPVVIRWLDDRIDTTTQQAYDIGKASVIAKIEVVQLLPLLVENAHIRNDIRQRLEESKLHLLKLLAVAQEKRPWVVVTIKTKQTIISILKYLEESVNALKVSGWVDDFEHLHLIETIRRMYRSERKIKSVLPSSPIEVLRDCTWLSNEKQFVIDHILAGVQMKRYNSGALLFNTTQKPKGIYIILTGLLKITYRPTSSILERLETCGRVPIVDCLPDSMDFSREYQDYMVSGQSVGILSFLTDSAMDCTVHAETHTFMYFIPQQQLEEAIEMSPSMLIGLRSQLWTKYAIDVATILLRETSAYNSQDDVLFALQDAFLPDVSTYSTFTVSLLITDIVLIRGVIVDLDSNNAFVAPCYVPRTVRKFSFSTQIHCSTWNIILIIPNKGVDADRIMYMMERTKERGNVASESVLYVRRKSTSNTNQLARSGSDISARRILERIDESLESPGRTWQRFLEGSI